MNIFEIFSYMALFAFLASLLWMILIGFSFERKARSKHAIDPVDLKNTIRQYVFLSLFMGLMVSAALVFPLLPGGQVDLMWALKSTLAILIMNLVISVGGLLGYAYKIRRYLGREKRQ